MAHDAVAAPSMRNARPWRFRCLRRNRAFGVWADSERAMPHSDPVTRGLHISTDHDHPEDRPRAGRAMERVLLRATLEGLAGSFLPQPLEWTDLRRPLRDPMAGTGHAQVLLRPGHGPEGLGTPRRPVSEVPDIEA